MSEEKAHPAVMTLRETAQYARISAAHLSNMINGKVHGIPTLRHARVGRRVVIRREWADAWLEELASQNEDRG
jgi:hypothetical protein